MKKLPALILALALTLSACSPFNAEQRDAVRAFGDLLSVLPPEPSATPPDMPLPAMS